MSICDGLRVVDFSEGMAGSLATMALADNGADVIKIEPLGGSPDRRHSAFAQWNRGKKSVTLNLSESGDVLKARELATTADVVVESFGPGRAETLGLGFEDVSRENPQLVYCSISAFGTSGPYRHYAAHEAIVHAKAGRMMEFSGTVEREGPVFSVVPVASWAASQLALQGILAALRVCRGGGAGQRVETSLLDGLGCHELVNWWNAQMHERFPQQFPPPTFSMGPSLPYLVAMTRDGYWLQMANLPAHLFQAFVRAVEMEEVFAAVGFGGQRLTTNITATEDLWELLLARIQERTLDEWMEVFLADADIAVEVVRTTQEAFEHPQVLDQGLSVTVHDPVLGECQQLRPMLPLRDPLPRLTGAPLPGQDNDTGWSATRTTRSADPAPPEMTKPPLAGITVLELASFVATPLCGALLADLGARVIKVEPVDGDPMRSVSGGVKWMQGKQSIALDLKTAAGRRIVQELAARADVFIHNYRPGVPERLGIDYASLSQENPRLIHFYAASYGSTGPFSERPAFHPSFGALAGGQSWQAGSLAPLAGNDATLESIAVVSRRLARANDGSPDTIAGLAFASMVMLALHERDRTGRGRAIEWSMLAANLYAQSDDFIRYEGKPPREQLDEQLLGLSALNRLYPTREGWVLVDCRSAEEQKGVMEAIGLGVLTGSLNEGGKEQNDSLEKLVGDRLMDLSADEWERRLAPVGLPVVRADRYSRYGGFFVGDPHMADGGHHVSATHPKFGNYVRSAPAVRFSRTPAVAGGPSLLGDHTDALLLELGYDHEWIESLALDGVVIRGGS